MDQFKNPCTATKEKKSKKYTKVQLANLLQEWKKAVMKGKHSAARCRATGAARAD